MGIGKLCERRPFRSRSSPSHYPSWGLETPWCGLDGAEAAGLITPHGDWKPSTVAGVYDFLANLITPHGDWKRRARRQPAPNCSAHYPSWGLETTVLRECDGSPLKLITPHGDWKLDVARHARAGATLITPHGDWKPRSTTSRSSSWKPSHYPSWGLETRMRHAGDDAVLQNSLPLMGIGNLSSKSGCHAVSRESELITPHGDWKPGVFLDEPRHRLHLITPHGDWKRPFGAAIAGAGLLSLPLMGIGNT